MKREQYKTLSLNELYHSIEVNPFQFNYFVGIKLRRKKRVKVRVQYLNDRKEASFCFLLRGQLVGIHKLLRFIFLLKISNFESVFL